MLNQIPRLASLPLLLLTLNGTAFAGFESKTLSACPAQNIKIGAPVAATADDKKKKGPSYDEKTIKVYQKARKAMEANQFEKARELLVPALEVAKKAPDQALILNSLGYIFAQLDDDEKAAEYTRKAIDSQGLSESDLSGAWQNLASFYARMEKHTDTLAALDSYIASGASVAPQLLVVKANTLARLEKHAEAACSLNLALQHIPNPKPEWLRLLMQTHYLVEDFEGAIGIQKAILENAPQDGEQIVQLANLYLKNNNTGEAFKLLNAAWDKGLLSKEKDVKNLATLYWNNGEYEKTIAVLKKGMEIGALPVEEKIWRNIAQGWKQANNLANAAEAYGEAGKLASTGESFLMQGEFLSELKRWEEAIKAYSAALAKGKLGSNEGHTYLVLGYAQFRSSDFKGAMANLQKAAKYPEKKKEAEGVIAQVKANM